MVDIYKSGAQTVYLVPATDAENESILKNPIPGCIWVNVESTKRLPVYVRPGTDLTELPRDMAADCAVLLQQVSPKKQIKQLEYCVLTTTSSFAKLPKQTTRVFKAGNPEALLASKKSEKIDFEREQSEFLAAKTSKNSQKFRENKKSELESSRAYKEIAEQNRRGYSDLFDSESMQAASNQNRGEDFEDDFM